MKAMDFIVKESGEFSSYDGARIYYESRGQGRPLIFCYGIGCLFNHWSPQIRHFSKKTKTIVFDYRGHHKSPIPKDKDSLTIEALARDLICLCEHLGIESADFVGHSFGVQVLIKAYSKRPELFRTMSFVNGLYQNPFESMVEADKLLEWISQMKRIYNQAPGLMDFLWGKGVSSPLLLILGFLTGGFSFGRTALKDIEIYARGVAAMDVRVFVDFFEEMIAFDGRDILSTLKVPTLILCGSKDALTPMEDQKRMNQMIQESRLHTIPHGSHCTQLDFPDELNLEIQNFIEP